MNAVAERRPTPVAADAVAGHNKPPQTTPFDQSKEEISELYAEATNWLDAAGVKTQADADGVSKLMDLLRQAIKRADERRVAENKPFDDGKAEVQARYNVLIADTSKAKGQAVLALQVCKDALAPFLKAQDDEKRARAEAARREADEKARAAQEAMRAAASTDLAARINAEAAVQMAKMAEQIATKADKDRAHAKGGSRAVGLTTTFRAEVTDMQAWARHVWGAYPDDLHSFLADLAAQKVRSGLRTAPGLSVHEERAVR